MLIFLLKLPRETFKNDISEKDVIMEDDMSAENSFPKGKTSPACHQVSHADIELFEVYASTEIEE